jgi:ribonuclease HI
MAWVRALPSCPSPTNQRAELTATVLAIQIARHRFKKWDIRVRLHVVIESDLKYAMNCMNIWVNKWCSNGWTNAAGYRVANRDLLEDALYWEDKLLRSTTIAYTWIPRSMNECADRQCNIELDSLQKDIR